MGWFGTAKRKISEVKQSEEYRRIKEDFGKEARQIRKEGGALAKEAGQRFAEKVTSKKFLGVTGGRSRLRGGKKFVWEY